MITKDEMSYSQFSSSDENYLDNNKENVHVQVKLYLGLKTVNQTMLLFNQFGGLGVSLY